MLLEELRLHLDGQFTYPVDLETVLEETSDVRVEAPDGSDDETLSSILAPLGSDTFESSEMLYETIYGNVGDDHIGRKYYDDRGGNVLGDDEGPRDHEDVSF